MIKIMLVEDDKSLREIYDVRLRAEGYDIKYAGDGEEALAMAVKEHPDLIISDVMMPKISGFDMLDILRATPETKAIKVIMMTALSSEDQRARGESLGADRYLVKSQVGIEDVVRTVHEVLEDTPNAQPTQSAQPTFTPGIVDPSIKAQPNPAPATQPIPAPSIAPTMQPETPSYAPKETFSPTPTFAANITRPDPVSTPAPQPTLEPQPAAQIEYAPEPAFEQPQFETTAAVAQPAMQPMQPLAPSPRVSINIVDRSQETQLPQPTAPFSTPSPTQPVEALVSPTSNPELTPGQDFTNNNILPPQNNGPIA
jgi:CheY-like chemotaxis protein